MMTPLSLETVRTATVIHTVSQTRKRILWKLKSGTCADLLMDLGNSIKVTLTPQDNKIACQ